MQSGLPFTCIHSHGMAASSSGTSIIINRGAAGVTSGMRCVRGGLRSALRRHVLDCAVGFQDEERMVEEQRSVAAELSARGTFGTPSSLHLA